MHAATLSAKFQICIPKPVREQMHLKAGQRFIFVAKGHSILLVPQLELNQMRGIMQGANTKNIRDRKDRY